MEEGAPSGRRMCGVRDELRCHLGYGAKEGDLGGRGTKECIGGYGEDPSFRAGCGFGRGVFGRLVS